MTFRHPSARRASALAAVSVAASLALAGCGDDSDGDSGGDSGASSDTRTVTDAAGDKVKVPTAPKKVVTLSEPTLDAALALGFDPIGATSGRGQKGVSSYLAQEADKAEIVATVAEPDLEKLAVLKPDLILLDETVGSKRVVGKLRDIAPTVLTAKLKEDWKVAFTATADALNKKAEATAWLKEFDADVRETASELGKNKAAVASVIRWQNGGPSVVGRGKGHVGSTLSALGLTRPKDQQGEGIGHSEPVSLEKLGSIDGDWLFFGALGDKKAGEAALKEARGVPNFGKLKAVRDNHVVVIEGSAWNSAGGPLAARDVLDGVDEALTS